MNRRRFTELFRAQWLAFVRDKAALFFTLLFPLMFLIIFGLLISDGESSRSTVLVTGSGPVLDSLPTQVLDVVRVDDAAEALEKVRNGDEAAMLEQRGDVLTLRFAASDQVQAGTIQGIISSVVDTANLRAAGVSAPRFTLRAEQVEDESLEPIEFFTPGILGWAVSIAAVFGAALTLVTWRDKRVLLRLRLAPVRLAEIAGSRVLVSILIAVGQVVLYIGAAVVLFDLSPTSAWWMSFPIAIVGTLAFLSVGLVVGAVSKTVDSASAIANLITLPMAFLSGAFFPLDDAPGWVQNVANVLPLKHIITGMTDTMVRGLGPASAFPEIGVLLLFTVVVGAIAVHPRVFRWSST